MFFDFRQKKKTIKMCAEITEYLMFASDWFIQKKKFLQSMRTLGGKNLPEKVKKNEQWNQEKCIQVLFCL